MNLDFEYELSRPRGNKGMLNGLTNLNLVNAIAMLIESSRKKELEAIVYDLKYLLSIADRRFRELKETKEYNEILIQRVKQFNNETGTDI